MRGEADGSGWRRGWDPGLAFSGLAIETDLKLGAS